MSELNKTLLIRTPEGIAFSLKLAGPVSRSLALAVDLACIYVAAALASSLLGIAGVIGADLAVALGTLASFAVSFGYPIVLEWFWRGQTVGKRLLRLQVMDSQGLRLQPSQIVIRNLLRVVDMLPGFYMFGGIACFLSPRGQRLGDLMANTVVVQRPHLQEPDLDQVLPGKYNSLREYPHIAARLRQNLTPAEAGAAMDALLRRDALDPDARLALFREMRAQLSGKAAFPDEVLEGLSDEQYLRNVVDIAFR